MRVLLNIYPWYLPKRSRELRVHVDLMALSRQFPELRFERVTSPSAMAVGNALFLLQRLLFQALPSGLLQRRYAYFALKHVNLVPPVHVRRKACDLLFAHEYFPINLDDSLLPIVYETQLLPAELLAGYGLPPETRDFERRLKGACARRSTLTVVRDPAARARFQALVPETADRIRSAPWYVPYLEALPETAVREKQRPAARAKLLFVGNEARRKGLPALLEAFERLPARARERTELVVVSRFQDGPVDARRPGVSVRRDLSQDAVLDLMREAQILALPTKADVFGIVLLEAMAHGCAVLSARRSPQDWILGGGEAGVLVEPEDAGAIARALVELLDDDARRLALALAGRRRFLDELHHAAVGRRYRELFEEATRIWRERAPRDGVRA